MSNPIDQEREAFEAWFNEYSLSVRMNGGSMNNAQMFDAWQARAAVQPAGVAVPEGWKLVPVVATEEMVEYVMDTGAYHDKNAAEVLRDEYRHMLAAAPHPVSVPESMRAAAAAEMDRLGYGLHESHAESILIAAGVLHPVSGEQKPDALRKRFSDIEDEIMAGKHNAASVFTAMRTAALYIGQPAAQDVDTLVAEVERISQDYEFRGPGVDAEVAISEMRQALTDALSEFCGNKDRRP